jgi:hypothetical protein
VAELEESCYSFEQQESLDHGTSNSRKTVFWGLGGKRQFINGGGRAEQHVQF